MPLFYNGGAIIPAPFVSISKEYLSNDDGKMVGSTYSIQVKGTLLPNKGSPNSTGAFWNQDNYPPDESLTTTQALASLLTKQDALRRLFSEQGQTLEIQPPDGSPPARCNPRIRRIEFQEGPWVIKGDYAVTMEADRLYINDECLEDTEFNGYYVSKGSEEWNFEIIDEARKTYRLTHSVSATGRRVYETDGTILKEAWERAQDYVQGVIGIGLNATRLSQNYLILAGASGGLNAYNYMRAQHINELGGTFSLTETWLCYDPQGGPAAIEDFNVSIRTTAAEPGRVAVGVEGTITGLEVRNNNTGTLTSLRYDNAAAKWAAVNPNLLARAETISGVTLNPYPLNTTMGQNQTTGVITYHYEYDNRPVPLTIGAISEVVTVNNQNPADVFAKIPVPGRAIGPILQSIQTSTERKRVVSMEVQMPPASMVLTPVQPNTDARMLAYKPAGVVVFLESDEEGWVQNTGRYTRHVVWTWE